MIQINLLPGAAKRKERQSLIKVLSITFGLFALLLIGFGVVVSLVLGARQKVSADIDQLDLKLTQTEAEIRGFDSVVEKTSLLKNKLTVINELLGKTNHWSDFLLDVAEATPSRGIKYVNLTVVESGTLGVTGIADSSVELERLLQSLEAAGRHREVQTSTFNSSAQLIQKYGADLETLLAANKVQDVEELMALERVAVIMPLFTSIELGSVSLDNSDPLEREVDKNVIFNLTITLAAGATL